MTVWLDNHLSPALAAWLAQAIGEPCIQVRDLGLARTGDAEIFSRARVEARAFLTKDCDFADLVRRLGAPPAIVLLAFGNTSTAEIKTRHAEAIRQALDLAARGEALIEIGPA